ncbi:MAG: inorganic phosphate transporter [Anaerolineales bacterium]
MLIAVFILGLIFVFLNGLNDSSNLVATVISTRALNPRAALLATAVGEFLGPFLFGMAVARTLGADLLVSSTLELTALAAGLAGAIVWVILTVRLGIPSSSSHALVGGLVGGALAASGLAAIQSTGLFRVLVALLISPPLGLIAGYISTKLVFLFFARAKPNVNRLFQRLQVITSFSLALGHGSNDGQKTMGVLALALLVAGQTRDFLIPIWVVTMVAVAIALGTITGGWGLIRTLGGRIMKVRPVHGFASQAGGAVVMLAAALYGGPVSLTQVVSSSLMGAGAAQRVKMVRWGVGRDMLIAWLLTIPASAVLSALFYLLIAKLSSN